MKLSSIPWVDQGVLAAFQCRFACGKVSRDENKESHFCSFFLPFDKTICELYLTDHIKARQWIPPGGHIDRNELPVQTVMREMNEELQYEVKTSQITLFDISIKEITNQQLSCRTHYDFWFVVDCRKQPFRYSESEFHSANWFSFEEGLSKMTSSGYRSIIKKLAHYASLG